MITIPAQEIKRCGISVVDEALTREPVHIIKNNRPQYVVLREEDYANMVRDVEESRLIASESEWRSGSVKTGTSDDLFKELAD